MKHAIKHIHFVGIGGAGMSGIAEVLRNLGYTDLGLRPGRQRHAAPPARTWASRPASATRPPTSIGADAVVTSTAVQADNPEVVAARQRKIPVVPRAMMLAELMRLKQGIAIAGTHGKTTTTSLVASVLAEGGLDPTFVIGGRLNSAGANAKLGAGDYIVVEADESDASFLNLMPVMAVVTNIDADHMETYGHDFGKLKGAFVDFLHRMPFYGTAILCIDDAAVREIVPRRAVPGHQLRRERGRPGARRRHPGGRPADALHRAAPQRRHAARPARHAQSGGPPQRAQRAVGDRGRGGTEHPRRRGAEGAGRIPRRRPPLPGLWRRARCRPANGGGQFTVIEDYGHHPVEIAATLAAARGAFPGRRLVLAFQPHRYTRTRDCFEDFVKVLGQADAVLLAEVYAAGEAPIVAADGRSLARAVRVAGKVEPVFVDEIAAMPQADPGHRARRRRGDVHGRRLHRRRAGEAGRSWEASA